MLYTCSFLGEALSNFHAPYQGMPSTIKHRTGTRQGTRKGGVQKIVVSKVLTDEAIEAKEGTFQNAEGCRILRQNADVYTTDGKLLAKFRKNVFSQALIQLGWDSFYQAAGASRSRGAAAGPINPKSKYWRKRKIVKNNGWWASYENEQGGESKMRVNNTVFSSVVGYFEATPFAKVPCRMTSYTQKYFQGYRKGIPFLQAIDRQFQKLVPAPYRAQQKRIKSTPAYRIADTAFSSVTINRNFRTALHKDAGDFKDGYGNLTVLERGLYHGGETLFPQYGIGIDLRAGDFVAMDVHEWHCNAPMTETAEDAAFNKGLDPVYTKSEVGAQGEDERWTRISFVCYVREKLADCNTKETEAYYKRIHFDPETGPDESK